MVFLTSIIIVFILYYLQADGLIFVTIIAVVGELINIFMTQTLSKSVEKKASDRFKKIENRYTAKISTLKKTIKGLEDIQEDSVQKIMKASVKIKEYEEKLGIREPDSEEDDLESQNEEKLSFEDKTVPEKINLSENKEEKPEDFIDLPSGSGRKGPPI